MKRILSLLVVVLLVFALVLPSFAETGGVGLTRAVREKTDGDILSDLGIIKGDGTGDLAEDKELTRQEMVAILNRLSKETGDDTFTPPKTPTFKDVPSTHWAYKDVELAYKKGLTSGIGNGLFGMDQKINANQASLFLLRVLDFDTGNIASDQALERIKNNFMLGLDNPVEGTVNLKRAQIFELMSKTLDREPQGKAYKLVERLGYEDGKVRDFIKARIERKKALLGPINFDPSVFVPREVPEYDEVKFEKSEDKEFLTKMVSNIKANKAGIEAFKANYLQGEYVETTLNELQNSVVGNGFNNDVSLYARDSMLFTSDDNEWLQSIEVDFMGVDQSLSLTISENRLVNIFIESTEGMAGSKGEFHSVYEYPETDKGRIFLVVVTEENYRRTDGGGFETYKDFAYATIRVLNKEIMETVLVTSAGTNYWLNPDN